jgi:DNA-binding MarR family transcriptional regulator
MSELRPLPEADLLRLAGLLDRVVEASLAAPEPPGKWCLTIERHYDPGTDAPVMHRLDQYLSDLLAYRDDAHLAAWQRHAISGQAWEAFSVIWRSPAMTLDELSEKLARRGYTEEDYEQALRQLEALGWIEEDKGGYWTTPEGDAVRDEVEALTGRYFYTPWVCLDESETAALRELLIRLREALPAVAA